MTSALRAGPPATLTRSDAPGSTSRTAVGHTWMLLLVVGLALGLRLWGITWQLPWRLHPDEVNYVEYGLTSAAELDFSSQYTNQPPLFRHLLTVEYLALDRLGLLGGPLESAETILQGDRPESHPTLARAYAVGRVTSAILGAATVLVLLLTVRDLLGTPVGLLSALLLSASFAHVRESHYALSTVPAMFFASLAVYASARFFLRGGLWRLLACCVCAAAAAATRDAVSVVAIVPIVALVLRQRRLRRLELYRTALVVLAVMSVAVAGAFVILSPQSVFGQSSLTAEILRVQSGLIESLSTWPRFRDAVLSLRGHMSKAGLGPVTGPGRCPGHATVPDVAGAGLRPRATTPRVRGPLPAHSPTSVGDSAAR